VRGPCDELRQRNDQLLRPDPAVATHTALDFPPVLDLPAAANGADLVTALVNLHSLRQSVLRSLRTLQSPASRVETDTFIGVRNSLQLVDAATELNLPGARSLHPLRSRLQALLVSQPDLDRMHRLVAHGILWGIPSVCAQLLP
jgi:hypothetical protein